MIKHIANEKDFNINTEGIVLVDYYADWCGPCKMMLPILEKIDEIYPEITILKVNVDNNSQLSLQADVKNIPTLDIYDKGKKITRKIGYLPERLLLDTLKNNTSLLIKG
jgi:thioredoxin 1